MAMFLSGNELAVKYFGCFAREETRLHPLGFNLLNRSEERRVGKECRCRWWAYASSRRRHTRWPRDWSSDVCSSDLLLKTCADDAFVVLDGSNRHATHRVMPGYGDVLIWKRIGRQVFWMLRAGGDAPTSPWIQFIEQIGRASCRERV